MIWLKKIQKLKFGYEKTTAIISTPILLVCIHSRNFYISLSDIRDKS